MSKQKNNGMMKPDKWKRRYWTAVGAAVLCLCCTTPAMAAGGDPLDIVNNLSDFIFSIIKALGVIILGWGIVQVGIQALAETLCGSSWNGRRFPYCGSDADTSSA